MQGRKNIKPIGKFENKKKNTAFIVDVCIIMYLLK